MERLDAFMARANAAYYATHDPFRDFTTSPEISQVFGEILGLWAAVVWEQIGRPDPVLLVEAGPGRGTLMADALRAIGRRGAGVRHAALRVHLIETSPRLRAMQAERVPGATWHERSGDGAGRAVRAAGQRVPRCVADPAVRMTRGRVGGAVCRRWAVCRSGPSQIPPPPLAGMGRGAHQGSPCGRGWGEGAVGELREAALASPSLLASGCPPTPAQHFSSTTGRNTARPATACRRCVTAGPLTRCRSRHSRSDRACRFRCYRGRRAHDAGADTHGPMPQGIFLTRLGLFQRTDRLGPLPAARPRLGIDRSCPPAGRTKPHGPAVQGTRDLPPWPAHTRPGFE